MTDTKNSPVKTEIPATPRGEDGKRLSAEKSGDKQDGKADRQPEHGGPKGLEPTRYGDWERNGRCTDF